MCPSLQSNLLIPCILMTFGTRIPGSNWLEIPHEIHHIIGFQIVRQHAKVRVQSTSPEPEGGTLTADAWSRRSQHFKSRLQPRGVQVPRMVLVSM